MFKSDQDLVAGLNGDVGASTSPISKCGRSRPSRVENEVLAVLDMGDDLASPLQLSTSRLPPEQPSSFECRAGGFLDFTRSLN